MALLGQTHTLPDGSQRLEIAFSDATRADHANGAEPAIGKKDIGDDDADGEDPFSHLEADLGLHLAGPLVEGEQVDGSEGVGSVDGARDEDQDPQPDVGKGCEAGRRLEVGEGL